MKENKFFFFCILQWLKEMKKKWKKKKAEPEMGYCPFKHWLGTGTGVGVGMDVRGARRTAQGRAARKRWALSRRVAQGRTEAQAGAQASAQAGAQAARAGGGVVARRRALLINAGT